MAAAYWDANAASPPVRFAKTDLKLPPYRVLGKTVWDQMGNRFSISA